MIRKIPFIKGEIYHVYNRGVNKMKIFRTVSDYKKMMVYLYLCNSDTAVRMNNIFRQIEQGKTLLNIYKINRGSQLVDIFAFCLMPNHFHILIREKKEGGIAKFMQKLSTAYAMYYNSKNERSGSVFEGKFKSVHVNTEAYLNYLFAYIHLNPLKILDSLWKESGISNIDKAKKFMDNYKYSSYYDYFIGDREEGNIINKKDAPEHFSNLDDFKVFVEEWRDSKKIF